MERFDQGERRKHALAVASLTLNVILTLLKGVVGLLGKSDALVADAAHSAADVAGSLAVWIGLRVARRPADENHPWGHGKAEVIAASLVAILLILAGVNVVIESLREFFLPVVAPAPVALYAALASAFIKEGMYQYQIRLGKKSRSPALVAGATDHRSDVYSSLAATAGIAIALLGVSTHRVWLVYADPLAGLAVAIVVVRIGYKLVMDSFISLMDQALDLETTEKLAEDVARIPGVLRLDDLRIRSNGSYWIVDVKIGVDPTISVLDGHSIARRVKDEMMRCHHEVRDVLVHVNPCFAECSTPR